MPTHRIRGVNTWKSWDRECFSYTISGSVATETYPLPPLPAPKKLQVQPYNQFKRHLPLVIVNTVACLQTSKVVHQIYKSNAESIILVLFVLLKAYNVFLLLNLTLRKPFSNTVVLGGHVINKQLQHSTVNRTWTLNAMHKPIMMFWVVTTCRLVRKYQTFGETHCLHFHNLEGVTMHVFIFNTVRT